LKKARVRRNFFDFLRIFAFFCIYFLFYKYGNYTLANSRNKAVQRYGYFGLPGIDERTIETVKAKISQNLYAKKGCILETYDA
jgi:hypothetical protein